MFRAQRLGALLCLAASSAAVRVASAESSTADLALARDAFLEARAAEKAGDWPKAIAKLGDAIRVKDTAGLRYHLAYCEEKLELLVEALVDYDRAEEKARATAEGDPNIVAEIEARRKALRVRLPTLTLTIPADAEDASLEIDGQALHAAGFGKPIPLNPGTHRVVVHAEGRIPFEDRIVLKEGDRVTSSVPLAVAARRPSLSEGPMAAAGGPTTGPRALRSAGPTQHGAGDGSTEWGRTFALATEAGVSTVLLGVGIGFAIAGAADARAADTERTAIAHATFGGGDSTCGLHSASLSAVSSHCEALRAAIENSHDHTRLATIGFVGAGVGAAAFGLTWLLWSTPGSKHALPPVQPSITRDGAGFIATASF